MSLFANITYVDQTFYIIRTLNFLHNPNIEQIFFCKFNETKRVTRKLLQVENPRNKALDDFLTFLVKLVSPQKKP
jgi:hypothetical protein